MPRTDRASRVIAAPLDHVYAALVNPEALTAWLPPTGMTGRFERFDPRPGGSYRLVLTYADASAARGKSTAANDIVESRFVDLIPGVRVVQAVDFVSGDPAYAGMEIQLIDDEGWPGKLESWQHTGAIYNVVPPKKQNNKAIGEWNVMKIVAKGRQITIVLNGETLVDANLEEYEKEHAKRHPGILREKGHVGFQSYNTRVEFRNVYLKPL